jgi:hypothetical protein
LGEAEDDGDRDGDAPVMEEDGNGEEPTASASEPVVEPEAVKKLDAEVLLNGAFLGDATSSEPNENKSAISSSSSSSSSSIRTGVSSTTNAAGGVSVVSLLVPAMVGHTIFCICIFDRFILTLSLSLSL